MNIKNYLNLIKKFSNPSINFIIFSFPAVRPVAFLRRGSKAGKALGSIDARSLGEREDAKLDIINFYVYI